MFYGVFASGELQPWAKIKNEEKEGYDNITFDSKPWQHFQTDRPDCDIDLANYLFIFFTIRVEYLVLEYKNISETVQLFCSFYCTNVIKRIIPKDYTRYLYINHLFDFWGCDFHLFR